MDAGSGESTPKLYAFILGVGAILLSGAVSAYAADIPGSRDPVNLKRFAGSDIIHYTSRSFDSYLMARAGGSTDGFAKSEKVEGAVTRIVYRVPTVHTALELLRNYETMLANAGYALTFELMPCGGQDIGTNFLNKLWWQSASPAGDQTPYQPAINCYFTAKATQGGQDINVAVLVSEVAGSLDLNWAHPYQKTPIVLNQGEVLVGLDFIATKAVDINMVTVQAADIAEALATKGTFEIYGVLFDIDKTDIKPESAKTLEQIAALLKIDRSLRLEVSGHTDNTGLAAHNMALSEGRARAVVDALVNQYGIDGSRLQAKGYGDTKPVAQNDTDAGKAKNRRVELRKL